MLLVLAFITQSFAMSLPDFDDQFLMDLPIDRSSQTLINPEDDSFLNGIKNSRQIIHPQKITLKQENFYQEDIKTLKLMESYIETLEEEEKPKYSIQFLDQIDQFLKRYPNIQELIYKIQDRKSYHKKLLKRCLKIKEEKDTVTAQEYREILDSLSPHLSTPIKQGTNKYHYPKTGLLPQGTPRRQNNFRHVLEGKMPAYVQKRTSGSSELTRYELHHLTQHDKGENIILLTRKIHRRGKGALHSYHGSSRINRSEFATEKHRATQLHMLKKLRQAYQIILTEKTVLQPTISPFQNEFFDYL